jgi:hypothetical protein
MKFRRNSAKVKLINVYFGFTNYTSIKTFKGKIISVSSPTSFPPKIKEIPQNVLLYIL